MLALLSWEGINAECDSSKVDLEIGLKVKFPFGLLVPSLHRDAALGSLPKGQLCL